MRRSEKAIHSADCEQDHQVSKRQWGVDYGAASSDDLGSDAEMSDPENLLQPDGWLQAPRLFSGKDYGTAVGQNAHDPTDWFPSILMAEGRGSGREKYAIDLNTMPSG